MFPSLTLVYYDFSEPTSTDVLCREDSDRTCLELTSPECALIRPRHGLVSTGWGKRVHLMPTPEPFTCVEQLLPHIAF